MNTRELQTQLTALGYSPGLIDGAWGRLTRDAVKAFQADHGLKVDGIVGPETIRALDKALDAIGARGAAPLASTTILPWVEEARRNLGLKEIKGAKHAAAIVRMLEKLKAPFRDDETAWCGTFAGWCIATTLPDEPVPASPWGSMNWLKFGTELKTPMYGCVAVFWRGSPSSWQGHVGFLVGQDNGAYHVLGGNQSDAVTITRIAKSRVRPGGLRWPATFIAPTKALPVQTLAGSLSTNEA